MKKENYTVFLNKIRNNFFEVSNHVFATSYFSIVCE